MAEVQSIFRLGRRPGEGVFCDADGLLVGEVALLERSSDVGDAQAWRPRPLAELNRDLSRCYGLPIEITTKAGALESIARALGRGDLVHAQMTALHLRLPDPPDLVKSAGDVQALIDLARRLDASGLLKGEFDPDLHPHWPAGSPGGVGGQFAPKDAGGGAAAASKPKRRRKSGAGRTYSPAQQEANRAVAELVLAKPKAQALLSAIADKESNGKYNLINGAVTFSDYSKHPNRHAPGRTSTAAGAFQFNNKTWNEVASLLGLTDFTPASQRLAAAYKLNHAGAVAKLEKDDIKGAIFDAAKVWDCLPKDKTEKSKWGHPRPLQPIVDSYNAALATLQTPKKAN
jgi:muramidase (phage lysozyme)